MTREEAIRCLSVHSSTNGSGLCTDEQHYEAKQMAIKALEQEPCEDAISRQAAIEKIHWLGLDHDTAIKCDLAIRALPSVNPQEPKTGHWIETAEEYYKAVNEYGGGVNEDTPYFVDDIACSECLAKYSVIDNETERFDHCPSCGIKMIEPQESEGAE